MHCPGSGHNPWRGLSSNVQTSSIKRVHRGWKRIAQPGPRPISGISLQACRSWKKEPRMNTNGHESPWKMTGHTPVARASKPVHVPPSPLFQTSPFPTPTTPPPHLLHLKHVTWDENETKGGAPEASASILRTTGYSHRAPLMVSTLQPVFPTTRYGMDSRFNPVRQLPFV